MSKWLFACIALAASFSTQASDDPWVILEKAAFAARELNYQGIFVYQNGNQMRSVQITHMNDSGHELARSLVLDGQPREVYSQGSDIVIFNPKGDRVVIEKRRGKNMFPAMIPTNLSAIKASYSAVMDEPERVVGREAYVVSLVPNDRLRYSYKVWADAEYGLLLKMILMDSDNRTLEQIGFTQLSMLNTHDLDWFQPKMESSKSYVMEDPPPTVGHIADDWVIANLPPGYRKIDHILVTVHGKKAPVNQLIYSDGMASVSIFIEPLQKGVRPKVGLKVVGSTNICANVIDGYQVVVVGEVPQETVMQISKSISFRSQATANK